MIITTARKPSSKTRIFCKHLSRFTGWNYITRGKSSLSMFAGESFLLVGESKGNPGSLNFFLNGVGVKSFGVRESKTHKINHGDTEAQRYNSVSQCLSGEHQTFLQPPNGRCVLSIRANVSLDKEIEPGEAPVIEGDTPLAFALSKAAGLEIGGSSGRVIHVNDRIEFIDKGVPYIILKLIGIRGEGIV